MKHILKSWEAAHSRNRINLVLLGIWPTRKKKNQHILGRSLPIPAQSHLSTEEKKSNPVRVELHCHIHHSELYQFLYFFCTMKSKVHTLILLTLTPLSK